MDFRYEHIAMDIGYLSLSYDFRFSSFGYELKLDCLINKLRTNVVKSYGSSANNKDSLKFYLFFSEVNTYIS